MQKYKFVEGVDEAWMEYDDRLPRDDQRAYQAEKNPLYLASEVDLIHEQNTVVIRKQRERIAVLEKSLSDMLRAFSASGSDTQWQTEILRQARSLMERST